MYNINFVADKPSKPGGRIYKPTSKLAELASTFKSVQAVKKQDDDYDGGKVVTSTFLKIFCGRHGLLKAFHRLDQLLSMYNFSFFIGLGV
jgi:hypothetical protein